MIVLDTLFDLDDAAINLMESADGLLKNNLNEEARQVIEMATKILQMRTELQRKHGYF